MIRVEVSKTIHAGSGWQNLEANLEISKGSLIAISGPSGAGKTTLLRMLAGLVVPDKGSILANDIVWFDSVKRINKRPQERKAGFVFQDYALFPNMTVRENIEFAIDKLKEKEWVAHLLELTGLKQLEKRNPMTLSGGQQQRLALARALAIKPRVLLLDEPFSALDFSTRNTLQHELSKIHKELNLTTILVTHEVKEINPFVNAVYEFSENKLRQREMDQLSQGKIFNWEQKGKEVIVKLQIDGRLVETSFSLDDFKNLSSHID